jgi:eukaryotic-like serine/threonine-protein kinase
MLLVTALTVTYVLFTMAAMKVALRAREIAVPAFVGRELSDAMTIGDAADLQIRVDQAKRIDPTVPAGRIAAQDPSPGSSVRRGRSVRLWVSAGSRERLVPRLVGDTQRTAQARLEQDGLTLAGVTELRSGDYAADVVVAQDPAPGARTGRVSLLVNRGERAGGFVMPDVIGVPGDAALDMLRSNGLRVTIVAQQPYPGVPPGTVLRQNPPAGFQITGEEPISLEVSR